MRTSPKLGLRIWNLLLDPYDHEQLADNWAKVDAHDHSEGRGVLIPTEGIADQAVSFPLIALSVFPTFSARGGSVAFSAAETKPLAGGPEVEILETGIYLVGLRITGVVEEAALAEMAAVIYVNGVPEWTLFEWKAKGVAQIQTTNFDHGELDTGDKLTIECTSSTAAKCSFESAVISTWRVG